MAAAQRCCHSAGRERPQGMRQKANDLAREAVRCYGVLGGALGLNTAFPSAKKGRLYGTVRRAGYARAAWRTKAGEPVSGVWCASLRPRHANRIPRWRGGRVPRRHALLTCGCALAMRRAARYATGVWDSDSAWLVRRCTWVFTIWIAIAPVGCVATMIIPNATVELGVYDPDRNRTGGRECPEQRNRVGAIDCQMFIMMLFAHTMYVHTMYRDAL